MIKDYDEKLLKFLILTRNFFGSTILHMGSLVASCVGSKKIYMMLDPLHKVNT
jgi:hypothetical protein